MNNAMKNTMKNITKQKNNEFKTIWYIYRGNQL